MPRQRRALVPPVDNEIVAFGLARNRFFDGGVQEIVALGSAERFTQVGRVFLPKAHIERAGAGDAHAIAGFAKIMGKRRDEAEPAAGLGDAHVTSTRAWGRRISSPARCAN
jgi:hypothetical protein